MTTSVALATTNPFVGPKALTEEDTLFGRSVELKTLHSLLIADRIVLLYSPSGAGKTSLLHAGLKRLLVQDGFVVRPTIRATHEAPPSVSERSARNRYLLSTLLSLEAGRSQELDAATLGEISLGQYLTSTRTTSPADDPECLLFDQFEELFTVDPIDVDEKEAFIEAVGRALRDPGRWAVFSMREEFVAHLDPYLKLIPTKLRSRFRLDLLRPEPALQAIQGPAQEAGVEFSAEAANLVVDDLRTVRVQRGTAAVSEKGPTVEPVQLQVVCHRLWTRVGDVSRVEPEHVRELGDVDNALRDFYDDVIRDVAEQAGVSERAIRAWISDELVTEQNYRAQTQRGPTEDTQGRVLPALENGHLVRADHRRTTVWYELAHDRLVDPIKSSNTEWLEEHLSVLQRGARLWDAQRRDDRVLLVGAQLEAADAWAARNPNELGDTERDFLEASHKEEERLIREQRSARRTRRLAIVATILLVLALVLGGLAVAQRNEARAQRDIARSGELALHAVERADETLGLALLVSLEAERIRSTSTTRSALLTALQSQPRVTRELWGGSAVQALTASPDRTHIAAGLRDGSVVVWEVATGKSPSEPTIMNGESRSVAFSSDGELVAVGTTKGEVAVLDADTGEPVGPPQRYHSGPVRSLSYSPDGKWLASGGDDGELFLLPTARDSTPIRLEGHSDWVNALAFSTDSKTLLSGAGKSTGKSTDQRILVWRVDDPTSPTTLGEHSQATRALALDAESRLLASVGSDGRVILWDLSTGRKRVLEGHTERLYAVAISPNGRLVASAGRDYDIRIWNTETGALVDTLQGRRIAVRGLAFTDDTTLVAGGNEATLRVWDLSDRTHPRLATPLADQTGAMTATAVSRDGRVVATGAVNNTVLVRDSVGGTIGEEPVRLSTWPRRMALSDDGSILATITPGGEVQLWDAKSGKPLTLPVATGDKYPAVAVSGDGHRVATGGDGGVVRVWQRDPGRDRLSLVGEGSGHTSWVTGLVFSSDGQTLASSGADGVVWLWDPSAQYRTGEKLNNIPTGQFTGIAMDKEGKTIAAGDREGRVLLWRLPRVNTAAAADFTLDELADVSTAPSPVTAVAFSADGKLAAMADDGAFALWETGGSRPSALGRTLALGERTYALAFAGDGKAVVTGLASGGLLWDLNPASWRDKACDVANRNLSPIELKTLLDETTYRRTCPGLPDTRPVDTSEDIGADE